MSTRSGIKFNNPPVSDRELRRRKRAAEVAAEAAAEAAAIEAAEAAAKALQATKKKAIPGHKKKQKKKKKQNKSPFSHQTPVKTFPFGIESSLVASFNDFYEIHCRLVLVPNMMPRHVKHASVTSTALNFYNLPWAVMW
jgi:hypothetical protein